MAKVAVATTDGVHIDGEFHSVKEFYIYEVNDRGEYNFLENRPISLDADRFSENTVQQIIIQLPDDLEGVLAEKIDPYAAQLFYDKGIIALTVNLPIHDAVPIFGRKRRFLKRGGRILRFCGTCSSNCGSCHSIL